MQRTLFGNKKIIAKVFALSLPTALLFAVGCATSSRVDSPLQKQTAPERDSLAHAFERIAKGPLQADEAPGFFLIGEQLYFERKVEKAANVFSAVFEVSPTLVCGMRLTETYLALGKSVEAERIANKLAVLFPQSPEAPLAQARVLALQGKNHEAILVLKEAYSTHKEHEELGVAYIEILTRAGRKGDVVAFLERAVKEPAVSAFMLEKLAEIRIQEKRLPEAKALLERLLRVAPEDIEGWTLAGFVAVEEKDYKNAEKYFREAYLKQPANDTLARYYVMQLLRMEKYQEARRLLLRLENSVEGDRALDSELTFQLALVLFKLEDYAGARARFLNLARAGGDSGRAYYYAGQCDEMLKNHKGALDSYSRVPSESSFLKSASQRNVYIHLEMGDFAKAKSLAAALSLSKESDESEYLFFAAVHARFKEHAKAIGIAKAGLAKFPASAELATLAATWLEFTESRDAAVKATEAVLNKFPKHAAAYNYLAYTLAEMNLRLPDALQFAQKAVAQEPKNGFYLDTLGWVWFKKQSYSQAELFLNRAFEAEPGEPVISEHLGELALKKGEFGKALKHFEGAAAKFAAEPEWRVLADREWAESRKRVSERIQELREKALSQ
jgi:tetratricopeptide (TPR) repeat protein